MSTVVSKQEPTTAESIASRLEQDGIAVLHNFIPPETLRSMQQAFALELEQLNWNNFGGYEKTEPYRHMVQDVLRLEQGFVDIALHPVIKQALNSYIGNTYALVEAKGWLSNPTTADFNGWHGDCWYDQQKVVSTVPREVKVAFYLTDVESGYFQYVRGTHGQKPRPRVPDSEVGNVDPSQIIEAKGRAGTLFLFDTSGTHRQAVPILQPRRAVFYNYHDPRVPLQKEDIDYYRYHPLLLNAAFLGGLDSEDQRILGFGEKANYIPFFKRKPKHRLFHQTMAGLFDAKLRFDQLSSRVQARVERTIGR